MIDKLATCKILILELVSVAEQDGSNLTLWLAQKICFRMMSAISEFSFCDKIPKWCAFECTWHSICRATVYNHDHEFGYQIVCDLCLISHGRLWS